jgi:uncharacterized protein YodC (DUF2158 family)
MKESAMNYQPTVTNESMALKNGDAVTLKSGSPILTVVKSETVTRLTCQYKDENGMTQEITAPSVCFEPVLDLDDYDIA